MKPSIVSSTSFMNERSYNSPKSKVPIPLVNAVITIRIKIKF